MAKIIWATWHLLIFFFLNEKTIKQNKKEFTRTLDRTLTLAYSFDTMIEKIREWKNKDKSKNNKMETREFTWFGL
jgi:hypothetical protein